MSRGGGSGSIAQMAFSNIVTLSRRRDALLWSLQVLTDDCWNCWKKGNNSSTVPRILLRRILQLRNIQVRGHSHQRRWISSTSQHPRGDATRFEQLIQHLENRDMDRSRDLWSSVVKNEPMVVLQRRQELFKLLRMIKDEKATKLVMDIYKQIPQNKITEHDVHCKLEQLTNIDEVTNTILSTIRLIPKEQTIQLVEQALVHNHCNRQQAFELVATVLCNLSPGNAYLDRQTYSRERDLLSSVLCMEALDDLNINEKIATCCLDIAARDEQRIDVATKLFQIKQRHSMAGSIDLHRLMSAYLQTAHYDELLSVYNNNPHLHDRQHYDILLACYAHRKEWDKLQEVFESLFSVADDLPNVHHYGIVMTATSRIARTDIVEMLYNGLVQREIKPTITTLNAVLYARLAFGDTDGVESFYNVAFKQFGVEPDDTTYMIRLHNFKNSKNLDGALALIKSASVGKSSLVGPRFLVPILSLCAERRDPSSALSIFKWIDETGKKPTPWMYNSLVNCMVESNRFQDAANILEHMKSTGNVGSVSIDTITSMISGCNRVGHLAKSKELIQFVDEAGLQKDAHYYCAVLGYYCHKKVQDLDQAEQIFQEIAKSNVRPNAFHYGALMSGYVRARKNDRAIQLYSELQSNNITPSYYVHSLYLRALSIPKDPTWNNEALAYLVEFLRTRDLMDLSSKYLSRDKVPPKMLKFVMIRLLRDQDLVAAEKLMSRYYAANPNAVNDIEVLKLDIELGRAKGNWVKVDIIWEKILEVLKENHSVAETQPSRYRFDLSRAINSKLLQLRFTDKLYEVPALLSQVSKLGLELSNSNINQLVSCYFAQDTFVLEALRITEGRLIGGYVHNVRVRLHKGPETSLSRYHLMTKVLSVMSKEFDRVVKVVCNQRNCDEQEATEYLHATFPGTTKALMRQSQRFHSKT